MKLRFGIKLFAVIEILIGAITLGAIILSLVEGKSEKPLEVLVFVTTTAGISASLGMGVLKRNRHAYHMLLYLSSTIILSKLLIFARIISLNGALETSVPANLKSTVSVIYHSLIILYFARKSVKKEFTN